MTVAGILAKIGLEQLEDSRARPGTDKSLVSQHA